MAWIYLIIAGICEVGWAIGLKYTEGFTKLMPSLWTALSMAASVYLLSKALHTIPVGTGYAAWTGIGVVGTAILGMILFDEPTTLIIIACIMLIILGIIGLKLFSAGA